MPLSKQNLNRSKFEILAFWGFHSLRLLVVEYDVETYFPQIIEVISSFFDTSEKMRMEEKQQERKNAATGNVFKHKEGRRGTDCLFNTTWNTSLERKKLQKQIVGLRVKGVPYLTILGQLQAQTL
ncbi:uncharacterized protein LOC131302559 isoform X1 [Rhododendron vialii]|uniref:uncharacterized protein LOC131302559 isoform X1 n=1 Tax=Rhododendron vialii TaxID=182163 RepID=UPI0026605771|nr:uncharacterized protein LOC131302559 isoform X1 [Rhododendron vialii]